MTPCPAALLLSSLLAGASPAAPGLSIDGQTSAQKPLGGQSLLEISANPGLEVLALADLSPGPTLLFGQSLPLGFSASFGLVERGLTDATGSFSALVDLPTSPAFAGTTVYLLGVVRDPAAPLGLEFTNGADLTLTGAATFETVQLAGNSLVSYPHFEYTTAFNQGTAIELGLDPGLHPTVAGRTADVYVVSAQTAAQWDAQPALVDVTGGGPTTVGFTAGDIQSNRFVIDTGTLSGVGGAALGVGYDVVVDLDRDGLLGPGDLIDGYGDEAGLYVVRDATLPGPYATVEALYSGGAWLGQNLFYPAQIATLGELPLVVISHGNGHNYQWYDHLGHHLASYGYVVVSHQNDTQPGIQTASTTTLSNTDYFLGNLDSIEGGALQGHVDADRIVWLGHSRGAEGVVRAYDRLVEGQWTPQNFSTADIRLVSSIAPTNFLGPDGADPHDVAYHLWVGGADADVTGCAADDAIQSFQLFERARDRRSSISLHGVGHGDFHNGGGSSVASGPCLVGRTDTHAIMRGYLLPLLRYHLDGDPAAGDFLWRQWESFRPLGAPQSDCVVVDLQLREGKGTPRFVIDDFQTHPLDHQASSGAPVAHTLVALDEGLLDDANGDFTPFPSDTFNGFTLASAADTSRGIVFSYDGVDAALSYDLRGTLTDWTPYTHLSFRSCQVTRNWLTSTTLGDQVFAVRVTDGSGNSSLISIDAYGGGVEEPYLRSGCGAGVGWANEMETLRFRLADFRHGGSQLDLADVAALEFLFGPSHGQDRGRLGLDDIELVSD